MRIWWHTRTTQGLKVDPRPGITAFHKGKKVPIDRIGLSAKAARELRRHLETGPPGNG